MERTNTRFDTPALVRIPAGQQPQRPDRGWRASLRRSRRGDRASPATFVARRSASFRRLRMCVAAALAFRHRVEAALPNSPATSSAAFQEADRRPARCEAAG